MGSTIPLRAYQSFQEIHRLSINVFVHVIADSLTYGVLRSELSDFCRIQFAPLAPRFDSSCSLPTDIYSEFNGEPITNVVYLNSSLSSIDLDHILNSIKPSYVVLSDNYISSSYQVILTSHGLVYNNILDCLSSPPS